MFPFTLLTERLDSQPWISPVQGREIVELSAWIMFSKQGQHVGLRNLYRLLLVFAADPVYPLLLLRVAILQAVSYLNHLH